MFAFLEGTIAYKQDNTVVVNVGGVGYELFVSNYTNYELPGVNETARVLTYLQVKEDGVCLYGFATSEEKELFLKLITVSGVGPKGAIGILSNITMQDLIKAISLGDIKVLSSIKGIGKKTAERIAIELKDKVSFEGSFDAPQQIIDTKAVDEAIVEQTKEKSHKSSSTSKSSENKNQDVKDDVKEVVAGYECGLSVDKYQDIKEGDILEIYEVIEEKRTLEDVEKMQAMSEKVNKE